MIATKTFNRKDGAMNNTCHVGKSMFAMRKGTQMGIYCAFCGKWIKWANKNDRNLIDAGIIPERGSFERGR